MPLNRVTFQGVEYRSQRDLLKHYDVPETTFWGRRKRGLSLQQCLGLEQIRPRYAGWAKGVIVDHDGIVIEGARYLLYEVVNLVNGKAYIGLTCQLLKARYANHLREVRHNYVHPLYHAMRKYGVENFEIRLIRSDARSAAELQLQEIQEIEQRNTTDRRFGYNLAPGGTGGRTRRFVIGDKVFPSQLEAAAHFGVEAGTFNKRIRKGFTPEQAAGLAPPLNIRSHDLNINGKRMNLAAAVAMLEKNYECVEARLRRGWTYQEALDIDPPPPRLGRNERPRILIRQPYTA